jgi:diguanylate cyclase (GGDEF)-like protein
MQRQIDTANIEIPLELQESWQKTVDLIAEVIQVPAALIMRTHYQDIEVFAASDSQGNPYQRGEKAALKTGLYCETVMANRERLLVRDARHDPNWDHNPDLELNMISYMGWPIVWPDGDVFGTICVLDNKPNAYDEVKSALLYQFKELVEFSLRSIYEQVLLDTAHDEAGRPRGERQRYKRLSSIDGLTKRLYDHRALLDAGGGLFSQLQQTQASATVLVIDVDHLKKINDRYGHQVGDEALAGTARLLARLSRKADILGRRGGDEFILLVPEITPDDARAYAERIVDSARAQPIETFRQMIPVTLSVGAFTCRPGDQTFESAIRQADEALMTAKSQGGDRTIFHAHVGPPSSDE